MPDLLSTPLTWRRACTDDAADLARIFNETIEGGVHSPMLQHWPQEAMVRMLKESRRLHWPVWVLMAGGEAVAWSQVRPIAWGQDVCQQAGDFSIYIARDWWGTGVAGEVIARVYREVRHYGFTSLSCWILGGNQKSLMLARAIRLQPWGRLPQVVNYGGQLQDLHIWGTQLDDPVWCAHIERLLARQARRQSRPAQRRGAPAA